MLHARIADGSEKAGHCTFFPPENAGFFFLRA